jgi:BlaI family transcriptional regulator, penicillinase repressor
MAAAPRPADPRELTEAEWRVMNAVWDGGGELSAREVLERLGPGREWAYTTLKTLMDRLVEKGALRTCRDRGRARYAAVVAREAARGAAVRGLVARAFEGAVGPLVSHLLGEAELTEQERCALERLRARETPRSRRR